MNSEMRSASDLMGPQSAWGRLQARVKALKDWEAENPALAEEWSAAMKEDHEWMMRKEREAMDAATRTRVPDILRAMGMPHDAVDALGRLSEGEHIAAARKFWAAPAVEKRFLLLLGTVGTGKTVAAAWVLGEQIARERVHVAPTGPIPGRREPGLFARAATFSRLSAYNADDREWFERMCECGVLVLDDLAAESLSQVGAAMLDELLDRRYGARLRTVITSNLSKDAFLLRLGDRAADRMRHFAVLSQSSGKSLRTKAARP